MRTGFAAIAFAALTSSAAHAGVQTATIAGAAQPFACAAVGAHDQLSGLYALPDGGLVCLQDFGELVMLRGREADGPGAFQVTMEWRADGPFELSGRALLTGWAFIRRHTAVGLIAERVDCPFETPARAKLLPDGGLLLERPLVRYDTDCCNLVSQHVRTEVLRPRK